MSLWKQSALGNNFTAGDDVLFGNISFDQFEMADERRENDSTRREDLARR